MSFTVALDIRAELGECPLWSTDEQAIYFVDIKGRALHRFEPSSHRHTVVAMPEDIGCIGIRANGGFIAGLRSGLWFLDRAGRLERKLEDNPEDQRTSRFNDGRVDPAGRFLAGTIDEPKDGGKAHLYRYDRRGLAILARGLLTSNGVAFSPDGRTLYHADTPTFTVWRYLYDPATGEATDRTLFVRLAPTNGDQGRPDGAAVDVEGCYWTALSRGAGFSAMRRTEAFSPNFPFRPAARRWSAFGGPDLKTLYVTSARANRPADELAALPLSGSLFSMRVEVPGIPEYRFDPVV